MADLKTMNEVVGIMLAAAKHIDDVDELKCVLGVLVDNWGAEKGLPNAEIFSIFEDLVAVQKQIYELYGRSKVC